MPRPGRGSAALEGTLVIDLSTMIAGPACARTLAEYGAPVIKVESPRPHHGPRMTCWLGIDVDQGKESLLLDIAEARGREVLWRLLDRADVIVHNLSKDAAARLDLGDARLRCRRRMPGSGGPRCAIRRPLRSRGPIPAGCSRSSASAGGSRSACTPRASCPTR